MKYLVVNDLLNHLFLFLYLLVVLPYLIIQVWDGPNWAYGLMGFIATGGSIVAPHGYALEPTGCRLAKHLAWSLGDHRVGVVVDHIFMPRVVVSLTSAGHELPHTGAGQILNYPYLTFSATWFNRYFSGHGPIFCQSGRVQSIVRLLSILLYGALLQSFVPEVSVALLLVALVANAVIYRHGHHGTAVRPIAPLGGNSQ